MGTNERIRWSYTLKNIPGCIHDSELLRAEPPWWTPLFVSSACRVCRLHRDDVEQHHDEQGGGELCIGSTDGNTSSVSSFYKASTVRVNFYCLLLEICILSFVYWSIFIVVVISSCRRGLPWKNPLPPPARRSIPACFDPIQYQSIVDLQWTWNYVICSHKCIVKHVLFPEHKSYSQESKASNFVGSVTHHQKLRESPRSWFSTTRAVQSLATALVRLVRTIAAPVLLTRVQLSALFDALRITLPAHASNRAGPTVFPVTCRQRFVRYLRQDGAAKVLSRPFRTPVFSSEPSDLYLTAVIGSRRPVCASLWKLEASPRAPSLLPDRATRHAFPMSKSPP